MCWRFSSLIKLVLAVLHLNKPCVCLETRLQRFMCLEDEVCHNSVFISWLALHHV
jgi:hypothetical protein